jgi:NAD-dependent SIR2 family protein deacetylase
MVGDSTDLPHKVFVADESTGFSVATNENSIGQLAEVLCNKKTLIITGAGLSVASGIPTFRAKNGVWDKNLLSDGTREKFKQWEKGLDAEASAIAWWNKFWLPTHGIHDHEGMTVGFDADREQWWKSRFVANAGHHAITQLVEACPWVRILTQNIDNLHGESMRDRGVSEEHVVEVHGRVGLFKCIKRGCQYAKKKSLTPQEVGMEAGAWASAENLARCPRHRDGGAPCLPQSLFFDENYDSHTFYQNEKVEEWLHEAEAFVFVGTSCAVGITQSALYAAAARKAPVFNLNLEGLWVTLEKMVQRQELQEEALQLLREDGLRVCDVLGKSEVVLPSVVDECATRLGSHSGPIGQLAHSGEEEGEGKEVPKSRHSNKTLGLYCAAPEASGAGLGKKRPRGES